MIRLPWFDLVYLLLWIYVTVMLIRLPDAAFTVLHRLLLVCCGINVAVALRDLAGRRWS